MKKRITLLLAVLGMICMTGCSTKESAVNNLRNLTEEIGANYPGYDAQDWAKAKARYETVNNRIARYDYTPTEKSEIGELQGRCMGYFAKGTLNTITDKVTGVINQVGGIIQGVKDAFSNGKK